MGFFGFGKKKKDAAKQATVVGQKPVGSASGGVGAHGSGSAMDDKSCGSAKGCAMDAGATTMAPSSANGMGAPKPKTSKVGKAAKAVKRAPSKAAKGAKKAARKAAPRSKKAAPKKK